MSARTAHILPQGGVMTLRSFTKLGKPVEGTIVSGADGVSRITTTGATGQRQSAQQRDSIGTEMLQTVCVERYDVLSPSNLNNTGTSIEGQTSLRGLFVNKNRATVGVAVRVTGALGKQAMGQTKPILVFFADKDKSSSQCTFNTEQQPHTTYFSTQTSLMPLAPTAQCLNHIDHKLPQLLVACVNGIYSLQSMSTIPRSDRLDIFDNLVQTIRYVVDGRSEKSSGGFLCRLSHDTIAVLSSREDSGKAVEIQRTLQTGPFAGLDTILTSSVGYAVSQSLLDIDTKNNDSNTDIVILRQAAERSIGPNAKIHVQPLADWQTPPVVLDVRMSIVANAPLDQNSSEPVFIQEKFLLHGGQLGVTLSGTRPTIRPLHIAEEPGSPERHFSRVLSQAIQDQLARLPKGAPSQEVMDGITKATAAELRENLTAANLFAVPIEVRMNIKQLRTPGTTVTLPSGMSCLVPAYAYDKTGPRLSALLGVLPSLGVLGVFIPWDQAELSGVPLGNW